MRLNAEYLRDGESERERERERGEEGGSKGMQKSAILKYRCIGRIISDAEFYFFFFLVFHCVIIFGRFFPQSVCT